MVLAGALLAGCGLAGCGATTLRVAVAPTLDVAGNAGFEATASLGIGWPLDFGHRSQHFVQGLVSGGGGFDGHGAGVGVFRPELAYLHWSGGRFDVRAGGGAVIRNHARKTDPYTGYGVGGHVTFLPAIWQDAGGWLVQQVCIGGELRVEYEWADGHSGQTLFVPALVMEANFLAAGD